MRHPFAQLTAFAVTAFAIGVAYRYVWDDPSQGSIANYMRSGAHAMGLAACGLGAHLYFNARLSHGRSSRAVAQKYPCLVRCRSPGQGRR